MSSYLSFIPQNFLPQNFLFNGGVSTPVAPSSGAPAPTGGSSIYYSPKQKKSKEIIEVDLRRNFKTLQVHVWDSSKSSEKVWIGARFSALSEAANSKSCSRAKVSQRKKIELISYSRSCDSLSVIGYFGCAPVFTGLSVGKIKTNKKTSFAVESVCKGSFKTKIAIKAQAAAENIHCIKTCGIANVESLVGFTQEQMDALLSIAVEEFFSDST